MLSSLFTRQLWILIESTPAAILLKKNDLDLVVYLLQQLEQQQRLNLQQLDEIIDYIYKKLTLIRDLADARHQVVFL